MRDTSFLFTRPVAPNSPDLNPVDCRIWGEMQQRLYQPKVYDVDGMKQPTTNDVTTQPISIRASFTKVK